jgi:hypothetical protein
MYCRLSKWETRARCLAIILVFWLVGVPAAVITATELGSRFPAATSPVLCREVYCPTCVQATAPVDP